MWIFAHSGQIGMDAALDNLIPSPSWTSILVGFLQDKAIFAVASVFLSVILVGILTDFRLWLSLITWGPGSDGEGA